MDAFFAGLPLADVHQDVAHNIKSIRVSQNLFDDLSDDPADWEIAQQHELATKPHTYGSPTPLSTAPSRRPIGSTLLSSLSGTGRPVAFAMAALASGMGRI